MSIAELPSHEPEFERTPPHDMAAEQCVLGGMLLSQDAIAEVIETLRAPDFYRPAHQIIYETILDLYGRGEPSDAVTISAELTKRGEIARVGGAPYLHTLISSVPTAANAGYYAKIVHERSVLRKLVEVGTRITQRGYAADGADADAILDWAEAEVLSIAEKRAGEDYLPLSEIMPGTLDEIEAIGSRGGQMVGVPTGFQDLDALTNGLHSGQMIIIAARPAVGKALALDTVLPTPIGWTTMGQVRVGDDLVGADGKPIRVVAATEVMYGRPCYEVEFSDGEVIVADADHQWRTSSWTPSRAAARIPSRAVRTTREICATVRRAAGGEPTHAIEGPDSRVRFIVDVRPAGSVPVRCVQVDAGDHLYLAGRSGIPTHNSTLALDLARAAAVKHGLAAAFFSLEMSRNEITMRLLSAEARRRRLDPAGPPDERGLRGAAVHRRLAEHVHDGDQGQVPAAQTAARPAPGSHRLSAADDLGQTGGKPPGRGLGVLPLAQAARQRARRPGRGALPAQPRPRAAHRQKTHGVRSAGKWQHRARCRRCHTSAP